MPYIRCRPALRPSSDACCRCSFLGHCLREAPCAVSRRRWASVGADFPVCWCWAHVAFALGVGCCAFAGRAPHPDSNGVSPPPVQWPKGPCLSVCLCPCAPSSISHMAHSQNPTAGTDIGRTGRSSQICSPLKAAFLGWAGRQL